MHPLLEPYPDATFDKYYVDASQKAIETGDSEAIKTILSVTATAPDEYKKCWMLPIIYANLDPARIPVGEELEELLDSYRNDEYEMDDDEKWPWCFHTKYWMLLFSLSALPDIPPAVWTELWPRVFAWCEFLADHTDVENWIEPNTIYRAFSQLLVLAPLPLTRDTPGVRKLVAGAWASFFNPSDKPEDPKAQWFLKLSVYIQLEPTNESGFLPSSVVDEYVAGSKDFFVEMDGSPAHKLLDGLDRNIWAFGNLLFKHIRSYICLSGRIFNIAPPLSLALKIHPHHPVHRVLAHVSFVFLSTNIELLAMPRFAFSSEPLPADAAGVFNQSARLWLRAVESPAAWTQLPESVFGAFLNSVVCIAGAARTGGYPESERLAGEILDRLAAFSVQYSVLSTFDRDDFVKAERVGIMKGLGLPSSPILAEPWERFLRVAKERLRFKRKSNWSESSFLFRCWLAKRAAKSNRRSSSRLVPSVKRDTIATPYAKQTTGKHTRMSARPSWAFHAAVQDLGLFGGDRAFLRHFLLDLYQSRKHEIFSSQLRARRALGTHAFYTRFDFSLPSSEQEKANRPPGSVTISCLPFSAVNPDDPHVRRYDGPRLPIDIKVLRSWEVQKADHEARAERDGRMQLLCAVLPHRDLPTILPLRFKDTAVRDGLTRLAEIGRDQNTEGKELDRLAKAKREVAC
ncbi:MYND-type domain-containing protein [Mycena chlorophos]|uniref:MYND-type domain-containing protein n=1 Tax=Mycena chlorophos TaxID=658473 RepID=A0A8H6TJZ5_MYCCL|nr:MYND-type domain-containing protein [Mycena chlorophos]